ncbi:unnamed protein product [Effrenium voratum]|nr:unnamed protein product [Effrenium voratum]
MAYSGMYQGGGYQGGGYQGGGHQGGGYQGSPYQSQTAYPGTANQYSSGYADARFPGGSIARDEFRSAPRAGTQESLADYQHLFKFIIIGDEAVGKTCLLLQFTDKRYRTTHQVTVGVEFGSRTVEVAGSKIKLQCWDTAGQDRFRSIIRSYYRGAAGMLLVYDITQRDSFEHILQWLKEARENADPDLVITLVGNKADKAQQRQISYEEGQMLARRYGLLFLETSAVTGQHVDDAFLATANQAMQLVLKQQQEDMSNHGQDGYTSSEYLGRQQGYMQTLKLTPPIHSGGGAPAPAADSCC